MIITEASLAGVYIVDPEPHADARGMFARTFCADEFKAAGLAWSMAQCSVSYNAEKGTLRGMHFQAVPHEEEKLVRCTAGAVFDAVVDIRPGSPTFGQWAGRELSSENRRALYIPKGFAHGFMTLTDNAEVFYQISTPYVPDHARGFRWDDADVGIQWPGRPSAMSPADAAAPGLSQLGLKIP